ncbi:MAG: phenylpyruvate tautomerase MIF-related protein [Bacillota bacterium]|nr:phenylpyruvate tautomerase MIF-related protein [Bacillota bacterium]
MPYISSTITMKLSDEKKDILKAKLGKLMQDVLGKSEDWLFVGFNEEETIYFKGEKKEKAAVIEVKILGIKSNKEKETFTSEVCKTFTKELSISGENIYVIFTEVAQGNWGWNGGMF